MATSEVTDGCRRVYLLPENSLLSVRSFKKKKKKKEEKKRKRQGEGGEEERGSVCDGLSQIMVLFAGAGHPRSG